MTSLFISYSRKDIEIAKKLTEAFKGQDLDFWIDWEGIPPTVDWWKEIERGIEQADIFLFLLSPDSATSKVCKKEIEHAVKNGKRLIPVVIRDVKADEAPNEFRPLNWIFLRESDNFQSAFNKIITAIKTDYDWVQSHRQLQVKALEWERNNHENGFLLHGKELQDAEVQLARNASKEPYPTDLQREYVLKSRQATEKQRRITFSIAIAGVIALAALAVFGFIKAGQATEQANQRATAQANAESESNQRATAQAKAESESLQRATAQALAEVRANIARAGELDALSVIARDNKDSVSYLLGIEAFRLVDNARTRSTLMDNLYARPQLKQILVKHKQAVTSLVFSHNGKILASGGGGRDGIVLWNTVSGMPIASVRLQSDSDSILNMAFSHDSAILTSVSYHESIVLDTATGHLDYENPIDHVYSVAFAPDGRIAAWGTDGGISKLFGQPTDTPLQRFNGGFSSFAISPDLKILASGSRDNTVILWDWTTGEQIGQPLSGHKGSVINLTFSPDGRFLVSQGDDKTIIVWDVATHKPIGQPLQGTSIAFSPDSKTLTVGSDTGDISLWDIVTGKLIGQPLSGHRDRVTSLAFSPDGRTLASGDYDGMIVLWDLTSFQPIGQRLPTESGGTVAFSPNGKTLASGSDNGNITLWDVASQQPIGRLLTGYTDEVNSIALSPDGKTLASGIRYHTIILWDMASQQPISPPLSGFNSNVVIAFSPDGKILASASCGKYNENNFCVQSKIILWNVTNHQPIGQPLTGYHGGINSLVFSPDGKILASGDGDGIIILWNLVSHQPVDQPLEAGLVYSVAISPDGKILASGGINSTILWDMATYQQIGPSLNVGGWVWSVVFSPDGKTLASASDFHTAVDTGTIILSDLETHQVIGESLKPQTGLLINIAFSPDSKTLASGGTNGIILWDVNPQSWVEKTCQRVGRNFTRTEWAQYFPDEEYRKTCEQWPLEPEATPTP